MDREAACIAGLRREFSLRLIRGISTYWFDLFGRWFEGEAVFGSIAQMRKLWDRLARPREESAACGDWCWGPRVEGAFLSGAALAL